LSIVALIKKSDCSHLTSVRSSLKTNTVRRLRDDEKRRNENKNKKGRATNDISQLFQR